MTTIWSGLAMGSIYAAIALGYNIVFLASGKFNFAQAQFVMLGTFGSYVGIVELGLPWWVIITAVLLIGAVLGLFEELIAVRPVHHLAPSTQLLATIAFGVIFTGIAAVIWGTEPLRVDFGDGESITLLGGLVQPIELIIIVVCVSLTLLMWFLSVKTMWGLAALASAEDRDAASLRGINVTRLSAGAFALAAAIGMIVGAIMAPKTFALFSIGNILAIKGFIAMAIGSFGSIKGGLIGGLAVGLVESFALRYGGGLSADLVLFFGLIVLLLALPGGIFGSQRVRAV